MAFARRLAPAWQAVLGREFLGLYLIGSLAHGGFSRRYSDIDAAVVTETTLSSHTLESLRRQATAMSDEWGPKFWCSGPTVSSASAAFRRLIASTILIGR